ncbi:hypothetical protein GCM10027447_35220 [Glycomyces halotolerans]
MSTARATCTVLITVMSIIAVGCSRADESPKPDRTEPTEVESTAPVRPGPIDFSSEAEQMSTWDDTCQITDPTPIIERFDNVRSVELSDRVVSVNPNDDYNEHVCTADLDLETGFDPETYLTIAIFDSNVEAFDRYYGLSIRYPYIFSDAEVDKQYVLDEESSWNALQITAQETPTVPSEQRVVVAAVMLGDFYTVELLVRFDPDVHQRADCDATSSADCTITATHVADFLATDPYLEDLHANIEATFERAP